jgi:hypothetical protein
VVRSNLRLSIRRYFSAPLARLGTAVLAEDEAAVPVLRQKVEGNTLRVKYKDGEKTIVVPSDAEVVNLVAGDKADLKTGAHVFIPRWEKQGDGTWQATVVVVGRDGITPPM